jgi:hypothetical protein
METLIRQNSKLKATYHITALFFLYLIEQRYRNEEAARCIGSYIGEGTKESSEKGKGGWGKVVRKGQGGEGGEEEEGE